MTEEGVVHFGASTIQYQIVRRPRRKKTLEITVDSPGIVTVAAPVETPGDRIEATVRKRAKWIVKRNGTTTQAPPRRRFVSGESLPYLGRSVRLTVRTTDREAVKIRFHHWQFDVEIPNSLSGDERREAARAAFEQWYRERAAQKLPDRVDRIASLLGVRPKEILIRDQRKRWASCAIDGTLRFNWRVIMAAPALIDYLVAHELAHLKVRGHSSEYWEVVAQAIPDYRQRRERLRETGESVSLEAGWAARNE